VKIEEYIKSLPNDIISGNDVQLPEHSFRKIFEFLNLNENDVFYHLGCGDGKGIKIVLQEFHVKKAIGVDNNKEKIQQAEKLVVENDLKDDLARQETLMDRLENKVNASQDEIDKTIDVADERFDARRDALYSDTDRKIKELEERLSSKLQRALDNPLAN